MQLWAAQHNSPQLELGLAQLWAAQHNSPWLELRLARHSRFAEDQNYYFQNPNGQTVEIYLREIQKKFEYDPTVNDSGITISLN